MSASVDAADRRFTVIKLGVEFDAAPMCLSPDCDVWLTRWLGQSVDRVVIQRLHDELARPAEQVRATRR